MKIIGSTVKIEITHFKSYKKKIALSSQSGIKWRLPSFVVSRDTLDVTFQFGDLCDGTEQYFP